MTLLETSRQGEGGWRESLSQLQAVFDLTQALARASAVEAIYEAALDGICHALEVNRASILLFDPDRVMRFKAWRDLSDEYRAAVEGHTPWTPETRDPQPVLVEDVEEDKDLTQLRPAFESEGIRSLAFFPLYGNQRVLGKFMLYHSAPHIYGADEVRLAGTIANQLAFAIERWRGELMLAESEARFRNVVETANDGVLVLDTDARVTFANGRLETMLGYGAGELHGRLLFDLLDPEAAEQARRNLERRRRGVREQFDFRFRHKDGGTVWGIVNAAPILDAGGAYQGSLTLITDITQRKTVEERYKALADSLPQMVLMAIPDGPLTYVNEVWTRYTSLDLDQTRAVGWRSLVHPDDRARTDDAWAQAHKIGAQYQVETRIRRHDGVYRWHLATAQPVALPDGRIEGWISSATDIHEMRRAQDRERFLGQAVAVLSASLDFEETLRGLAGIIVPAFADICVIDVADPELGMRRLEMRSSDESLIETLKQIRVRDWKVAPDSSEIIRDRLAAGEALLVPSLDERWIDGAADSKEHAALAKSLGARSFIMVPLKARNTTLGSLSLVLTEAERSYDTADLTLGLELAHRAAVAIDNARLYEESKRIAERLQKANEAKDEFLGLVSHEMRTPITTIYGNAQVLQRIWNRIEDADRKAALIDIEHDADRLQRIIENMLVLARVEVGNQVATEPVLLNRVVEAAVADLQRRYPSRRIDLSLPEHVVPVVGQPTYLELVLRNLIGNAHKYSPLDQPLHVTVEPVATEVRVCVEDHGPGVPAEEAQRIFEPFYRTSDAAAAPGAGMGLAVCRRLIEVQGGSIWAQNQDEGGFAVCFSLKVAEG